MSESSTPEMIEVRCRYDLPKTMTAAIGRIIVRWGYAEAHAQDIIYELLEMDQTLGRLAVREPRLADRITLIEDIVAYQGIERPSEMLKALRSQMDRLGKIRDLCAHGAWSYSSKDRKWCITDTRGKHDAEAAKRGLTGKKRIWPTGILFTPEDLNIVADEIENMIANLRGLRVEIGVNAWQKTLTERSQNEGQ